MRVVRLLDRWLEQAIIVVLFTNMVACLTYSTFIRYFVPVPFFTSLTHHAEEIAIFSFVWLLYWGSALATKEGAHFRVTAHFAFFPKRLERWQFVPGDLIWLAFNLYVTWQGMLLVQSAIERPEPSLSLRIPMEYIYAIIPLAFLLTSVRLVQFTIVRLVESFRKQNKPEGILPGNSE